MASSTLTKRVRNLPIPRVVLRLVSLSNILVIIWIVLIYHNERSVFNKAIQDCDWQRWEDWSATATPHRLALVADPQLIDPHSYPGRPWPLSSLTVFYTDLYLRRVYRLLQRNLYPDTTMFLGDLFDGGREWSTRYSQSPESSYRKYGDAFWHQEFNRFTSIYYDEWHNAGTTPRSANLPRRQIFTNIAGNHDLGFGSGIQLPVRARFAAYFGFGNVVNIIGNHTFVSLDTVSYSAKQADGAASTASTSQLWQPTQEFLDSYPETLNRTLAQYSALQSGQKSRPLYSHRVVPTEQLADSPLPLPTPHQLQSFPTILLTHVPLYREPATPCGALREKWPQGRDGQGKLLDKDERNAISIHAGYQYQNVLSLEISNEITSKLANVSYAFSGDDHDYCQVHHNRYASAGRGIDEITVKSTSWAMGVRRPAFQLVSLWNPHGSGEDTGPKTTDGKSTLQTSMCLLPDQLGLFLSYIKLLCLTLVLVGARAIYMTLYAPLGSMSTDHGSSSPLLPLTLDTVNLHSANKAESSSFADSAVYHLLARSRPFGQHPATDPPKHAAATTRSSQPFCYSPLSPSSCPSSTSRRRSSSASLLLPSSSPLRLHVPSLSPHHIYQDTVTITTTTTTINRRPTLRAHFLSALLPVMYCALPWYLCLLYLG